MTCHSRIGSLHPFGSNRHDIGVHGASGSLAPPPGSTQHRLTYGSGKGGTAAAPTWTKPFARKQGRGGGIGDGTLLTADGQPMPPSEALAEREKNKPRAERTSVALAMGGEKLNQPRPKCLDYAPLPCYDAPLEVANNATMKLPIRITAVQVGTDGCATSGAGIPGAPTVMLFTWRGMPMTPTLNRMEAGKVRGRARLRLRDSYC